MYVIDGLKHRIMILRLFFLYSEHSCKGLDFSAQIKVNEYHLIEKADIQALCHGHSKVFWKSYIPKYFFVLHM